MKFQSFFTILLSTVFVASSVFPKKPLISCEDCDSSIQITNKIRLDCVYAKNARLLNDENGPLDEIKVPGRHTWNMTGTYRYGKSTYGYDAVSAQFTLYNRGTWGDPEVARTDAATIKDLEAVAGSHTHSINVHVPIIKELWLELALRPILGIDFENQHFFKVGLFPFKLGRGIALGDAYAVAPDLLGFNPLSGVQQFAPGFLLTGDIVQDVLSYDIYGSILDNKADTFDNANLKTQGQQYGRRYNQARSACGSILNYLVAGRLFFEPFNTPVSKLKLEPYALFNDDREQRVEYLGDASTRLTTFGFALEMERGPWEFGCDCAFNRGEQRVKGWDRNQIIKQLRDGIPYYVNSQVTAVSNALPNTNDVAAKDAIYVVNSAAQNAIENSPQDSMFNGDVFFDGQLKNKQFRFRNPYTNTLGGSMGVFDMTYWVCRPNVRVSATAGYASGDINPNRDINRTGDSSIDSNYNGFISLQEAYSGKRVKSAFLMSGPGRVPRVLTFPAQGVSDGYPSAVSRFTNLVFAGIAGECEPRLVEKKWKFNPNVLWYWQAIPTRSYDICTGRRTDFDASKYLGYEINMFVETMLITDLKLFAVGSIFVPGSFFDDIKGRPINAAQRRYLDSVDRTGVVNPAVDKAPLHGVDKALFFNMGLEYKF